MFSRIYTSKVVVAMTAENLIRRIFIGKTDNSCTQSRLTFFLVEEILRGVVIFCNLGQQELVCRGKTNNELVKNTVTRTNNNHSNA